MSRPSTTTHAAAGTRHRGAMRAALGARAGSAMIVALVLAAGCGDTRAAVLFPGAATLGADGGAPAADDGGVQTVSQADFCAGRGAPVLATGGDGHDAACAGSLARGAFRYALCTCDGYVSHDALVTDSFDSALGAYDPARAGAGGSVGTNGPFNASGALRIGGALWGSDPGGLTLSGASETRRELHANGAVNSALPLSIGGDAYVNGDVVAQGDLTIAGTLHIPEGRAARVAGAATIARTSLGPVSVPQACDCSAATRVDVAAIVEAHRGANDDDASGIAPSALESVATDTVLALPCGRIFFTRVGGSGAITLRARGRTAIFVGGDLAPAGAFTIDVAPGSDVDVFVGGNVAAGGTFTLGSATTPASARLYVGGAGTLHLQAGGTLAGNVYAPLAEVVLAGETTVFGALFARRVSTAGPLTIHFDEAVLAKGGECQAPSTSCTTCRDCGNQACNGGTCGACTTSADCCAPLSCARGRCVPDLR